jgi:hypothetical protein
MLEVASPDGGLLRGAETLKNEFGLDITNAEQMAKLESQSADPVFNASTQNAFSAFMKMAGYETYDVENPSSFATTPTQKISNNLCKANSIEPITARKVKATTATSNGKSIDVAEFTNGTTRGIIYKNIATGETLNISQRDIKPNISATECADGKFSTDCNSTFRFPSKEEIKANSMNPGFFTESMPYIAEIFDTETFHSCTSTAGKKLFSFDGGTTFLTQSEAESKYPNLWVSKILAMTNDLPKNIYAQNINQPETIYDKIVASVQSVFAPKALAAAEGELVHFGGRVYPSFSCTCTVFWKIGVMNIVVPEGLYGFLWYPATLLRAQYMTFMKPGSSVLGLYVQPAEEACWMFAPPDECYLHEVPVDLGFLYEIGSAM